MTNQISSHTIDIADAKIAFIQAGWHSEILANGRTAFIDRVAKDGIAAENIDIFDVSGGYEIPLQAKMLAESGRYDAIVATALIVDGGIYRHDFVATAVIDGMMRVQLDSGVPVLSVVLTPHHFHEHSEHLGYFSKHFFAKGEEAGNAVVATIKNIRQTKAMLKAG